MFVGLYFLLTFYKRTYPWTFPSNQSCLHSLAHCCFSSSKLSLQPGLLFSCLLLWQCCLPFIYKAHRPQPKITNLITEFYCMDFAGEPFCMPDSVICNTTWIIYHFDIHRILFFIWVKLCHWFAPGLHAAHVIIKILSNEFYFVAEAALNLSFSFSKFWVLLE